MDETERAAIYRLHAGFCKTLSDANRLLMINELSRGEITVTELARRLGMTQSNVSKHLALLREQGLVLARREGPAAYYALSDERISQAIALLREVQMEQLEKRQALVRLGVKAEY